MPSIFTHYIAGQKVLESLTDAKMKESIESQRRIFDLGLQGPDFFKFFGAPFQGEDAEEIYKTTEMLEERAVSDWMGTIVRYARALAQDDKTIVLPYLLGYMVHYALDCTFNPFIYYRCGFATAGAELINRFEVYRNRYNAGLDIYMLKKHLNKTPHDMDIDKIIWVDYKELLEVCRLYPVNLKKVYGKELSREDAIKAYQNMNKYVKTYIRGGITGTAAKIFETFNKDAKPFTSNLYKNIDSSIDYANLSKAEWMTPWDNRYPTTATADDLFDAAIKRAAEVVEALYKSVNLEISEVSSLEIIGGNSFRTGIAYNTPMIHKYYDCVFKKEEAKLAPKIAAITAKRLKNE